ncbi:hypothetical protein GB931_00440 [Modestobacter sp. I12A-02628]|uniref:Uncharacterized protein n=1 Tax=Goekera deserti TaxID=2497753 RepID=A0A7K3WKP8_9ACTN|nr:hypothetical protein [Goekera deserti]MPQ96415.1 hypothetical protein [Goekera deserti]NDI47273.1 hypothetical protein [Goekera deserti]NEL56103.1 hypothetical protein [Goekera deserti]
MRKPLITAVAVWVVVATLLFLTLDPVVAAFLAILGAGVAAVVPLAATWDEAPSFEERELARARKRAAHRERTKDARARDKARYEARQAKRAQKARH